MQDPERIRREVEGAELGDKRLNSRLEGLAVQLAGSPEASLPQALGDDAKLEAAYRFFGNDRVTPEGILAPHYGETIQRVRARRACVVAHDTTEFHFKGEREGLGRLRDKARGFLSHVALAVSFDEGREPLGVVGIESWSRPEQRRARQYPKQRRLDPDRESQRWWRLVQQVESRLPSETHAIHVMDREADAYDLLGHLVQEGHGFVVRMCKDRRIEPDEDGAETLLAANTGQHVATRTVPLSPRRDRGRAPSTRKIHPAREGRDAKLRMTARAITLRRPREMTGGSDSLTIHLVTVEETDPPADQVAVCWRLYTSEPIGTESQVLRVVDAYRCRWQIEEYFKALKSGCAIEKRQLEHQDALLNLLAVYIPIAWQLLALRSTARRDPNASALGLLSELQLRILAHVSKRGLPQNASAADALRALAALGGHQKQNGDPGWRTLWAGLHKLLSLQAGYRLAKEM